MLYFFIYYLILWYVIWGQNACNVALVGWGSGRDVIIYKGNKIWEFDFKKKLMQPILWYFREIQLPRGIVSKFYFIFKYFVIQILIY